MSAARTEEASSDAAPQAASDERSETHTPPPLTKDEIFDTLKASRRRAVLRYLDENGGTATTGTLAEHIAAVENGIDRSELSSSQRKRVYVALYQAHLPRMDDFGVIEYDADRGDVRLCDQAEKVLSYLYYEPEGSGEGDEDTGGFGARIVTFVRRLFGRS